jgi:hypothetical protein
MILSGRISIKGDMVMDLLFSFIGSLIVLIIFYSLYVFSSRRSSRKRAYAKLWWLPGWQCFRFVIRNMHSEDNLIGIKYRAWLRSIQPPKEGCSVKTFIDVEIISGERILLPGGQDLPVICFRFENKGNGLKFIYTDKLGVSKNVYDLGPEVDSLKIEYSLKIQGWGLFKVFNHEVVRIFEIPHYLEIRQEKADVFKYLLDKQKQQEQRIRHVFLAAEDITISM